MSISTIMSKLDLAVMSVFLHYYCVFCYDFWFCATLLVHLIFYLCLRCKFHKIVVLGPYFGCRWSLLGPYFIKI